MDEHDIFENLWLIDAETQLLEFYLKDLDNKMVRDICKRRIHAIQETLQKVERQAHALHDSQR